MKEGDEESDKAEVKKIVEALILEIKFHSRYWEELEGKVRIFVQSG